LGGTRLLRGLLVAVRLLAASLFGDCSSRRATGRFYVLFAGAFLLYSAVATAWIALRNKPGEWLGSLLPRRAGLTLATAFDAPRQILKVIASCS